MRNMHVKTWEENEVALANEGATMQERSAHKRGLGVYNYFYSVCGGYDAYYVKRSFDTLFDRRPMSPITDAKDEWCEYDHQERYDIGQSIRYPSLFKKAYKNGKTVYLDFNRVKWCNTLDGLACCNVILDEMIFSKYFPISLPYMPNPEPYKVICEYFEYTKEPENPEVALANEGATMQERSAHKRGLGVYNYFYSVCGGYDAYYEINRIYFHTKYVLTETGDPLVFSHYGTGIASDPSSYERVNAPKYVNLRREWANEQRKSNPAFDYEYEPDYIASENKIGKKIFRPVNVKTNRYNEADKE